MIENQIPNPVAAAAVAQAHSEHGQDPKVMDPQTLVPGEESAPSQVQTSEAQKKPSAITVSYTRY